MKTIKENEDVIIKQGIIPEFISGSSTPAVSKQQRQVAKTLKQVQGLTNFIIARGFTLIELLVVVLIIGILSAIALPQYQKAVKKARGEEVLLAMKAVDRAASLYYLEHGTYKGMDVSTLDIKIPDLSEDWHYLQTGCDYSRGRSTFFLRPASLEDDYFTMYISDKQWRFVDLYQYKGQRVCLSASSSLKDYFNCRAGTVIYPSTGNSWPEDCLLD